MSHRLIHFLPRKFTLSGSPIHVARFPAAPFPRAPLIRMSPYSPSATSISHRLIHFLPRKFTLSGSPIHVARFPAAPFPRPQFLCFVRPLHAADGKERLAY